MEDKITIRQKINHAIQKLFPKLKSSNEKVKKTIFGMSELKDYPGLNKFNKSVMERTCLCPKKARLQALEILKRDEKLLRDLRQFFLDGFTHWKIEGKDDYEVCKSYLIKLSEGISYDKKNEHNTFVSVELVKARFPLRMEMVFNSIEKMCRIHPNKRGYGARRLCASCYSRIHRAKKSGINKELTEQQLDVLLRVDRRNIN